MIHYKEIENGFEWGSAKVIRILNSKEDMRIGRVVLGIETVAHNGNEALRISITKTGKIHIFDGEYEWLPACDGGY